MVYRTHLWWFFGMVYGIGFATFNIFIHAYGKSTVNSPEDWIRNSAGIFHICAGFRVLIHQIDLWDNLQATILPPKLPGFQLSTIFSTNQCWNMGLSENSGKPSWDQPSFSYIFSMMAINRGAISSGWIWRDAALGPRTVAWCARGAGNSWGSRRRRVVGPDHW